MLHSKTVIKGNLSHAMVTFITRSTAVTTN